MKNVTIQIVGRRPLLMHSSKGMQVQDQTAAKRKKIPTPTEEAEMGAYRLPDGTLYLPSEAFAGSVRRAASSLKVGKTPAKMVLAAGLFFLDEFCPLHQPGNPKKKLSEYVIDTRRAVIQGNGVMRSRPRLNEWACEVRCEYDPEILSIEAISEFFKRAGQYVGVGDQRPGAPKTPGQFGTYEATVRA